MKLRKFVATDMRDAIAQVKKALGADAMIVATRPVRRGLLGQGVEVTAAIDSDDDTGIPGPAALDELLRRPPQASQSAANPPPRASSLTEKDIDRLAERIGGALRGELRGLRAILRPLVEQRADAGHEELRRELAALRQTIGELGRHAPTPAPVDNLVALAGDELVAPTHARTLAIVGPTGIGKTTTIAKLAARAALIEQQQVALVSLDTFRVGGEDQIRAFADLMGVPLYLVSDPERLPETLDALGDFERVFIDTAGRSPRDPAGVRELELALGGEHDIEVQLALAGGTPSTQIDLVAERFAPLKPSRLVFTKCDEATDLAELVRAPRRLGVPVSYLTSGQRVPEDIEDASAARLLDLAQNGFTSMEVAA